MNEWTVYIHPKVYKDIEKFDRPVQKRLFAFLDELKDNPYNRGKFLKGTLKALYRYRVGDYRIIVEIQHQICTVCVVRVGHRRDVYI